MATTKICLNPKKSFDKNNRISIVLRIYHKRVKAQITTGYNVFEKDFIEQPAGFGTIKKNDYLKSTERINKHLFTIKQNADNIIEDLFLAGKLKDLDVIQLKELIQGKKSTSLITVYFDEIIDRFRKRKQFGNASAYDQSKKFLIRIYKKQNIEFREITPKSLENITTWYLSNNNNLNGLSSRLRPIRAIFNMAIREGLINREIYPFDRYQIKSQRTIKKALNINELKKIKDYIPSNSSELDAKNIFLLSLYLSGINFANLAILKKENIREDFICIKRVKTGTILNIPISNPAREILKMYIHRKSKYILPIIAQEDLTGEALNKHIINRRSFYHIRFKTISQKLGFNNTATTYVARHSFATLAKNKNINIAIISEMLGHSNIKTTQTYLMDLEDYRKMDIANSITSDI